MEYNLLSRLAQNTGKTKEKHNKATTKNTKLNRENKTKMGSLTRGGENPIPKQKTKGEKTLQKTLITKL